MKIRCSLIMLFSAISLFAQNFDPQLLTPLQFTPKQSKDSNPADFTRFGDLIYFSAESARDGRELWVTNGDPGHLELVADLKPGSESSRPGQFLVTENGLYFQTNTTDGGLWLISEPGSEPRFLGFHTLVFDWLDDALWYWRNSGELVRRTSSGETAIPLANPFEATISKPILFQNEVWFLLREPSLVSLWRSDGSVNGTHKVKDLIQAPDNGSSLVVVGEHLFVYFHAYTSNVDQLWVSDGTETGTELVLEETDGLRMYGFTALGDALFFVRQHAESGFELWRVQNVGLALEKVQLEADGVDLSPQGVTAVGDRLLFFARPTENRITLFSLADNELEPQSIADLDWLMFRDMSYGDDYRGHLRPALDQAGRMVFEVNGADPTRNGYWRTDGTQQGTELVYPAQITAHEIDAMPLPFGDNLLTSQVRFAGKEAYVVSDQGVQLLGDIEVDTPDLVADESTNYFIPFKNNLLFVQQDPELGTVLWRTDGTLSGTHSLYRLSDSQTPGRIEPQYTTTTDRAFFTVSDADRHRLWVTDGTDHNTTILRQWPEDTKVHRLILADDRLFVQVVSEDRDEVSLWATTNSQNGLIELSSSLGSAPKPVVINDQIYFYETSQDGDLLLKNVVGNEISDVVVRRKGNINADIVVDNFVGPIKPGKPALLFTRQANPNPFDSLPDRHIIYAVDGSGISVIFDQDIYDSLQVLIPLDNQYFFELGGQFYLTDGRNSPQLMERSSESYHRVGLFSVTSNNRLYYLSNTDTGSRLWMIDDEVRLVQRLNPAGLSIVGSGSIGETDVLAVQGIDRSLGLWVTNGDPNQTSYIATPYQVPQEPAFASVDGKLLFRAKSDIHGSEWHRLDLETGAVSLAMDLAAADLSSYVREPHNLNGKLVFSGNDQIHGLGLWSLASDDNPDTPDLDICFKTRHVRFGFTFIPFHVAAIEPQPGATYQWSLEGGVAYSRLNWPFLLFRPGQNTTVRVRVTFADGVEATYAKDWTPQ